MTEDYYQPEMTKRRSAITARVLKSVLVHFIHQGQLQLRLPDGEQLTIGEGKPSASIWIHDWKTVWKIVLNPDLCLGEAYMDETLTVHHGDIYGFLDLCLANLGRDSGTWARRVHQKMRWFIRRLLMHNPIAKSQKNVAHHYDLSDQLYELFLDADRQYSCAYFQSKDDSLEQAQANKKRHIAAKLLLAPDQKILDIGSGWGGLGLYLSELEGADVTGLTLSKEQLRYANEQAKNKGIADRVRFCLRDYRQENGHYDRIVSVGMFEHLGAGYFDTYFSKIASLLTNDGVALVHTIGCINRPSAPQPWISKYIFPGGYIPSLSEITPAIERSGLVITDLEILRLHYAETLKAWRQRFMQNRDKVAELYDGKFCRMWEFYLASCEAGFRHNGLVVFQIQLAKTVGTVPLTRDYLTTEQRLSNT